ncbi:MFS transporter [Ureibacillus acetophenoni]|uniref:DHA2 family multidrug resistance protein-like MFS transporter n=1 Tax=Ureibacillus acetophenoni TaxID=614649 RepID=A0A285UNP6_9BACL|nr:MFS transporter [Ureibacillus acetophenoni]SOC43535.1 DHA2 family multidrug resistance protein-like MFS transporter [Ureibacillus acetophenoni]
MENGYKGTNKMIIGIVFGVITFWLFAQAMVNVVPEVQKDLGVSIGTLNIAISLAALFSGLFIVAAGGLADKVGRKKIAVIGFILSIIGSLCLVFAQGAVLLVIGRVIQGISAAFIMPSTIALIKAYFDGPDRQRALSFWSIGSWGGSGFASFAGGAIATSLGWRWIFIFSIIFAIVGLFLLKDTPESKQASTGKFKFDYAGLGIFIVTMIALNLFITYGAGWGWTSVNSLIALAVAVIGLIVFVKVEKSKEVVLVDFAVFKNKAYTGATVSNFLLNAIAGALIVTNTYVQQGRGYSSFQSGMLSLGYLVVVLLMIRVGEKVLQRIGAKKPMIWGGIITTVGVAMMALTFLPGFAYTVSVFVGFALYGLGLGLYATPSTDTSVTNAPADKVGEAAGVYKMASSLGGAFGVAISATAYGAVAASGNFAAAGTVGLIVNIIFGTLSVISVMFLVPNNAGKTNVDTKSTPRKTISKKPAMGIK